MSGVLRTDIQTLPVLLQARGAELGDQRFVRDAHASWSYGEFADRVRVVAAGLQARGVRRGDVVAVVLPNSPAYLEAWWAILWAGAVFNPINPALTVREAIDILADSGARTVLCPADRVGELSTEMVPHFWQSVSTAARITLHLTLLAGANDHHRAEALFKAAGRALREAVRRDAAGDPLPSTKGTY